MPNPYSNKLMASKEIVYLNDLYKLLRVNLVGGYSC